MNLATARRDAISAKFRSLYGTEPTCWVRAPGRAELLGTDTDDHLGYVMTMGIHLDTWIAFKPTGNNAVRVHSMNLENHMQYAIGMEPDQAAGTWDRYISGVSRSLRLRGYPCRGVDAIVHSIVPIGGGLSSSASLEVATALMFQAAGGFSISKLEIAEACQQEQGGHEHKPTYGPFHPAQPSAQLGCQILHRHNYSFSQSGGSNSGNN